jgi:beta-N-acetylhexosaminidase
MHGPQRRKHTGLIILMSLAGLLTGCEIQARHSSSQQNADRLAAAAAATRTPPNPPSLCTNSTKIRSWSVSRRAAQLIVAPAIGLDSRALSPVIATGIGGIVILGNAAPTNLANQVKLANALAPSHVPLVVMADEEGGGVQRLHGLVSAMPWARQMAASMTPAQVQQLATRIGRQMKAFGVNVDLAPVLDVDGGQGPNRRDADGLRSFSPIASIVARYGVALMKGLIRGGVTPVVKHFPGLGQASGNTDSGPATTLPIASLRKAGLLPFEAAIVAGAPGVMTSNAAVPGLTQRPASLSASVVQGVLRGQLGYRSLVLTDSLSAGAVQSAGYSVPAAAGQAVIAGNDMILFGSTLTPTQTALLRPSNVKMTVGKIVDRLVSLVHSGALSVSRLDRSVLRVLKAKKLKLCAR